MAIRKIAAVLLFLLLVPAVCAQTATIDVPAVDDAGNGIMTTVEVEIVPGEGRVLVNSAPLIGLETQDSERVAVKIASEYADFNFSKHDIIFTVMADAAVVEGPSAGAAMAVVIIAALEDTPIREDASITGTLQVDGSISYVGDILEKAETAADSNKTLFLIPAGQSYTAVAVPITETIYPGWEITKQTTTYVNVAEYAEESWGMTVLEVPNIYEAVRILLHGYNNISSPLEAPATPTGPAEGEPSVPAPIEFPNLTISAEEPLAVPQHIEPMAQMADEQIEEAIQILADAQYELTTNSLDEDLTEYLQKMLNTAYKDIERARDAREKGVLYGAANFAFRSTSNSQAVFDIAYYESLESSKEQAYYLGDRIAEANKLLDSTEEKLGNVQRYVNDPGSYEWAVAAEERLVQAQELLDRRSNNSITIFQNLALIEGWAEISGSLYDVAAEESSDKYIDTSVYQNESEEALFRAAAELEHYGITTLFGPAWYAEVAAREYQNEWYLASYLDASVSVSRVEAGIELNTRSWEDLALYISSEIQNVETYDTVWGTMYRDYAEYTLAYAVANQDTGFLKESLEYARQAEVFAETAEDVRYLPSGPRPLIEDIAEEDVLWLILFFIAVMFTGIFFGYMMIVSKPRKRKHK
jgi:uncharacterized protein